MYIETNKTSKTIVVVYESSTVQVKQQKIKYQVNIQSSCSMYKFIAIRKFTKIPIKKEQLSTRKQNRENIIKTVRENNKRERQQNIV